MVGPPATLATAASPRPDVRADPQYLASPMPTELANAPRAHRPPPPKLPRHTVALRMMMAGPGGPGLPAKRPCDQRRDTIRGTDRISCCTRSTQPQYPRGGGLGWPVS